MATETPPAVGAAIALRRAQLGLSIRDAARRAGVARSTWHSIERGERTNVLERTLASFDKALMLETGTLHRLAESGGNGAAPVAAGAETDQILHIQIRLADNDDAGARRTLAGLAETADVEDVWYLLHVYRVLTTTREEPRSLSVLRAAGRLLRGEEDEP